MKSGIVEKISRNRSDIIIFLVLLAAAVKYVAGIDRVSDVLFYDESLYLLAGVKLAVRGLYCPECGPLYAPLYNAWYFMLSFLTSDNLALYWLNYKLMTIIPALLTYVLLRKNNVSMLVSSAIAVLVLTSAANLPVWPKPSHMGIIVILLFLIPSSRSRSLYGALAFGAAAAFIASYVRPEYFLTFGLLTMTLLGSMIVQKTWRERTALLTVGGLLAGAAVVIAGIGLPVSASRSLCAFGQHFAIHWVGWTGSDLHPWVDWQVIFTQNFGQAHGVLDIVRNNPQMFMKHVGSNVIGLVSNLGMLFPTHLFGDKISKVAIGAVVAWLFFARRETVRENFKRHKTYVFIVSLFLLAAVISIVTVYPRPHYFIIPVVLLTTGLVLLLASREEIRATPRMGYAVLLSCLILAVVPSPYIVQGDQMQDNMRTIRLVQGMHISRPVNILEAEGGFDIYMGDNFRRIGEAEKTSGFRQFIASRDIGMVVLTELLTTDLRFRTDPEWKEFLANCSNFGFVQRQVPRSDILVFVRKDLLQ